jgi:hypothetical protein
MKKKSTIKGTRKECIRRTENSLNSCLRSSTKKRIILFFNGLLVDDIEKCVTGNTIQNFYMHVSNTPNVFTLIKKP